MSDISINSGQPISVSVKQPTLQNTVIIPKLTSSVSIKGVIGGFGADAHFVYNQGTPQVEWSITHNLGKNPSVTVVDSADNVVYGEIEYNSINKVTLTFAGAFSGKAFFN